MAATLEGFTPEQIEAMAGEYHKLVSNPATRREVLAATKKLNPQRPIPELDVQAQLEAELRKRDERDAKREEERQAEQIEARVRESRRELKEQGYETKDIEAIEKLMTEKGIPSYATAAEFYSAQRKLAEPTPGDVVNERPGSGHRTYSLPTDPLTAMKGGKKALSAWGRDAAASAIDDLRAGRVKLH
jgi:hypothetical protein